MISTVILGETFLLSLNGYAAEPVSLSMYDSVELALKQNRRRLEAEERLSAAEASLEEEFAKYRPKHFLEAERGRAVQEGLLTLGPEIDPNALTPFDTNLIGSQTDHIRADSFLARYRIKEDLLLPERIGGRLTLQFDLEAEKQRINLGSLSEQYVVGPKTTLTYKQPLTSEGRSAEVASLSNSRLAWEVAKQQYRQIGEEIVFEILTAYDELLRAKRATDVAREALKQTEQQVETAKTHVRLGVLAEIELMKLQVQLSFDQNGVIEAERREKTAHETLRNRLGFPPGVELNPTTTPPFQRPILDVDRLKVQALAQRPDLQALRIQQEIGALAVQIAKSLNDPFLTMTGAYSRQGSEDQFGEARRNFRRGKQEQWAALATITFPLFDGGVERAGTQRALAEKKGLAIALTDLEQAIIVEVEEAVREVESAARRFITVESSLKVAEEALQIDQFRFSRGQITTTDLLRSQLALFQLKQGLNDALLDHHIAQVQVYRATGMLSENIKPLVQESQ